MTTTLEQDIAQSVADVLRPVLSDLKALQGQVAGWEARWTDLGALRERVALLEVRAPVPGPTGAKGDPGERGEPGMPGLSGKDGAPGLDGKDGAAGLPGQDGAHGSDGAPGLAGKDGSDGLAGKDGADGLHGKDGAPGADGVGVMDALLDRDGHLVLTLADGRTKDVGLILGKDGAPGLDGQDGAAGLHGKDGSPGLHGKDGADGVGFDDLDLVFDDAAGWLLRFMRGTETKAFPIPLPWDTGPWQAGRVYPKGAGVMAKGCYWVAQDTARARPGDESPESRVWRLTVKCGRDGKPGRDGRDGVAE